MGLEKLGRIPEGDGWRVHGRDGVADRSHHGGLVYDKLPIAFDDHSRLAFDRVHTEDRGEIRAKCLIDAMAWSASQGIGIERVRTDHARDRTVSRASQRLLRRHRIEREWVRAHGPRATG